MVVPKAHETVSQPKPPQQKLWEFAQLVVKLEKLKSPLLEKLEQGSAGRKDWLNLLAIEVLASSPGGVRTVGAVPLPPGSGIMVAGGKITVTSRKSMKIVCTAAEIAAAKRSILDSAPQGADKALALHSNAESTHKTFPKSVRAWLNDLRDEWNRLHELNSTSKITKQTLLRQLAIEELFGIRLMLSSMTQAGEDYVHKVTVPVSMEFSMQEIEARARELEK